MFAKHINEQGIFEPDELITKLDAVMLTEPERRVNALKVLRT